MDFERIRNQKRDYHAFSRWCCFLRLIKGHWLHSRESVNGGVTLDSQYIVCELMEGVAIIFS